MFGTLGGPEILLLIVLALIVFGPRKLPEIGKSMGKMLAEFRRASNDFRRTIEDEVEAEKMREAIAEDRPAATPALREPAPEAEAAAAPVETVAAAVEPAEAPAVSEPTPAAAEAASDAPSPAAEPSTPVLAPPAESVSRE
jgi:sec-independent protein translocase protein TatA